MKKRQRLLTEEQWELMAPLFPRPKRRANKRGRPPAANRACLEGILWILQTGAAWRFLPDEFPSPSTCWRRLQRWQEQGIWLEAWRTLLGALDESAARERSGWYWQTVKAFRWEFSWKVPLRQKLRLRKPRWPKSRSRSRAAARDRNRSA